MRAVLSKLIPESVRSEIRALDRVDLTRLTAMLRAFLFRRAAPGIVRRTFAGRPENVSVLMVCHGNIYRSAFAHAALVRALAASGLTSIEVRSAGLRTSSDRPAPPDAVKVAGALGVSLDHHRSTPATQQMVEEADLVFAMDYANAAILHSRFPAIRGRILMLGALAQNLGSREVSIPDPYGQGADQLRRSFVRIASAVEGLVRLVRLAKGDSAEESTRIAARAAMLGIATSRLAMPFWERYTRGAAAVLMMHRFADRERGVRGHDPVVLASHLEYLRHRRYNLCSLRDLVNRLEAGEPPLPRSVVFTVDDGYADFSNVAAPIFALFDCPVTVFLVTGFLDGECWMWADRVRVLVGTESTGELSQQLAGIDWEMNWQTHAERERGLAALVQRLSNVDDAKRESFLFGLEKVRRRALPVAPPPAFGPMTWTDVHRLSRAGVDFGAHSRLHPVLSRVPPDRARREIEQSWKRLHAELFTALPVFCYPNGMASDFTRDDRATVQQLGLSAAVAAYGGPCTLGHHRRDRFALPRFAYEERPDRFRQLVSGVEMVKSDPILLFTDRAFR